jgi:DNA-directed RNA polymerase specialized sigma24 family protein
MTESVRRARFNELLERNDRRILAIARSYAAEPDTPDLIQEILLQVWRSLGHFRGQASIDTPFPRWHSSPARGSDRRK